MASDSAHAQTHTSPLRPRQYILITLFLAVVTAVELGISYSGFPTSVMVPILIVLSAIKFGMVVALFMHLRYEARLFTQMFVFGFVLASAILVALIAVFWNDPSDALGGEELPALEHADEAARFLIDRVRSL